jgi:hypothetical protein
MNKRQEKERYLIVVQAILGRPYEEAIEDLKRRFPKAEESGGAQRLPTGKMYGLIKENISNHLVTLFLYGSPMGWEIERIFNSIDKNEVPADCEGDVQ